MVNLGRILPEICGEEDGDCGRGVSGMAAEWRRESVGRERGK